MSVDPAQNDDVFTYGKPSVTVDEAVTAILRYGARWHGDDGEPVRVTYGFLSQTGIEGLGIESYHGSPKPLSNAHAALVDRAIELIADVANITFVETGDRIDSHQALDISIVGETASGGGWATRSVVDDAFEHATVVLGTVSDVEANNRALKTALHEVMHALGLSHPSDYNDAEAGYRTHADYYEDTIQYSVMSYWDEAFTGGDYGYSKPATPMLHDIAALQDLYGANMHTRTGDTTYGWNGTAGGPWTVEDGNQPLIATIWDAGGRDTIDMSGHAGPQTIDLAQGGFSSVMGMTHNLAVAYGAEIEDAVGGGGDDLLLGTAGANVLAGGNGNDVIYGDGLI